LSEQSTSVLTGFVENFLDAGFNPLFIAVRKLIEQDVDRLFDCHRMHYLFLVGWFLEAEMLRRKRQKAQGKENEDFGLVGAALHQNNFVVLMKLMKESFERGEKQNFDVLYASMICFTQILYVVREMETTGSDDDKDIAENMKLRLFYEEQSLDVLAQLPKTALKEPEPFLKAAIELNHILLKMLDAYSKQHTEVFIKSKRRRRARRKAAKKSNNEDEIEEEDEDDGEEPEAEAERVTKELKFEFSKFETKFINEETMDTYKRFFNNYNELTHQEIKWVLTFFHRVFVKREVHSMLFGLDFMRLLDMVLSTRDGLPPNHKSRPEVENFSRFYMAKLRSALSRTPSLYVELLFAKLPEHVHYLDHGYDEVKKSHQYKFSAVMQFYEEADSFSEEKQFAIVIAALLDDDKLSLVEWLTERLSELLDEFRKAHEMRNGEMYGYMQELTTDDTDKKTSMNKDGKFRLLLDMIGFEVPYLNHERCILPGTVPISRIETAIRYLKIYMVETIDLNGRFAAEFLKNPQQARAKRDQYEMDSGVDDSSTDDGMEAFNDSRFAALPEEEREKRKAQPKKSSSSKKRKKNGKSKSNGKDNEEAAAARQRREYEEMRNIKSSLMISPSDDESDEERDREFFESEARLRAKLATELGDMSTKIPDKEIADQLYRELNERWRNNADAAEEEEDDDLAPSPSPEPETTPAQRPSSKNNTSTNGKADDNKDNDSDHLALSSGEEDHTHPNGSNQPHLVDDNEEESLFVSDNENSPPKQTRRPRTIALSDDDD
jgi:replication fork protection complex subunit Tof1/Swi1